MRLSLSWLKEFVAIPAEPRRLKPDLTNLGLNVESFVPVEDDLVFEVEVTTNRPDCLSHRGIAREVSTLYRNPLKQVRVELSESGRPASDEISIQIADPDLCGRYCGRVIEGVQVKPSPSWLSKRLKVIGMRPINSVADITNYVLMELGHPLHAFDLARLKGKKIIVRRAKTGERLHTLDGVDRVLKPENLVIADQERPVALAGVMGGQDSEISSDTRAVLLESAWFDPVSVRRAAKAQGLHTEASHRFERGADIEMAPHALDRAAALIAELAGGQILPGLIDVYPGAKSRHPISLRASAIVRILGTKISNEEVERILSSLGFRVERWAGKGWRVTPPSFRLDVALEVDLIEEVARHYGYDRLPARVRPAPPRLERDTGREKELAISSRLIALGYREIITSSMVDPDENARFTERPAVVLANPLSQEASALRSSAVPSMLRALRWNMDRNQADLRFFELGKTYAASNDSGKLPDERRVLSLGATGHRRPASVHDHEKVIDFYDLKGDLEMLFRTFEIPDLRFEPNGCQYYEPALAGRFVAGIRGPLAILGQLSSQLAREYKLRQPVWLAEVDLELLLKHSLRSPVFQPFPKFPAVERDFSLLVPQHVTYGSIEEAVLALKSQEGWAFRPVDLFSGGSIPSGHYSLLLRVTFQSQTHTLTSEEIGEASRKLLTALESLDIRLRS